MNKNNNKGSNTRRASTVNCIRLIYNTIHIFYRYTEWTNGVSCAGIVASQPTCCIVGVQTFLVLLLNATTARHRQYGGIPVLPHLIAVSGIITNHTRHQYAPQVSSTPLNAQNAKLVMFELNNGISAVKDTLTCQNRNLTRRSFPFHQNNVEITKRGCGLASTSSCLHITFALFNHINRTSDELAQSLAT